MTEIKPKIEFVLVCDDVRREDNGKLLAIGMYASNMLLPSFPARMVISLLLAMQSDEPGDSEFEIVISAGKKTVVKGQGTAQFETAGLGLFPLKGFQLEFTEPTELDVRVKIGDGRFKSVRKLGIEGPTD